MEKFIWLICAKYLTISPSDTSGMSRSSRINDGSGSCASGTSRDGSVVPMRPGALLSMSSLRRSVSSLFRSSLNSTSP